MLNLKTNTDSYILFIDFVIFIVLFIVIGCISLWPRSSPNGGGAESIEVNSVRFFNSVFLQYFKQEDTTHNMSAGESQSTSNNTGTEYTMHSGPTDIDTDVKRHFMNGKLIFNSVYR